MFRVLQKQAARLLIKFQSYKSNETCGGGKKIDKQKKKKTTAKPGNLQIQQSSSKFVGYHHFQQPEKG